MSSPPKYRNDALEFFVTDDDRRIWCQIDELWLTQNFEDPGTDEMGDRGKPLVKLLQDNWAKISSIIAGKIGNNRLEPNEMIFIRSN